jgi:hypothetical protein
VPPSNNEFKRIYQKKTVINFILTKKNLQNDNKFENKDKAGPEMPK